MRTPETRIGHIPSQKCVSARPASARLLTRLRVHADDANHGRRYLTKAAPGQVAAYDQLCRRLGRSLYAHEHIPYAGMARDLRKSRPAALRRMRWVLNRPRYLAIACQDSDVGVAESMQLLYELIDLLIDLQELLEALATTVADEVLVDDVEPEPEPAGRAPPDEAGFESLTLAPNAPSPQLVP